MRVEDWQIADLPCACETSYLVLTSQASAVFALTFCCCTTALALYVFSLGRRAEDRQIRTNYQKWASLIFLLTGIIGYLNWSNYAKSDDIREHAAAVPGRFIKVEEKATGKGTHYIGTYSFRFNNRTVTSIIELPSLSVNDTSYLGRSFTVLLSRANPDNFILDLNCPQPPAK